MAMKRKKTEEEIKIKLKDTETPFTDTESDDDFNKLFPVHVDSTFDFFTHLRQRFTQERPF